MQYLQTIILMLIFLALFGCQGNAQIASNDYQDKETNINSNNQLKPKPTVKIGEKFTLKNDGSVKVEGANIEITVNQIGRKWLANGSGESLDFTFSVKYDGKTQTYSHPVPDLITAGGYKIEVAKTEPFGDGYAIFVVTKKDSIKKNSATTNEIAAKFVESFGWHIDESVSPTLVALEIPHNFDNLPFYHYQSASQRSGIDMTSLSGKKFEMLKYTLKEKQNDPGQDFTNFAHLIIENGQVMGAWRTDSSARTPGIYSFVKR